MLKREGKPGTRASAFLTAPTDGAVNQDIVRLTNHHRIPGYPFQPDPKWKPFVVVSARPPQEI